jgi:hypothetical protein
MFWDPGGQPIVIENLEDLMEDSYFVEFIRVVLLTQPCVPLKCKFLVFNIKDHKINQEVGSTVACPKHSSLRKDSWRFTLLAKNRFQRHWLSATVFGQIKKLAKETYFVPQKSLYIIKY